MFLVKTVQCLRAIDSAHTAAAKYLVPARVGTLIAAAGTFCWLVRQVYSQGTGMDVLIWTRKSGLAYTMGHTSG